MASASQKWTGFQFAGLLKSRKEIKSVCSRLQNDGIVCDS